MIYDLYIMRMTFNINDTVAREFLTLVPNRKRSGLVSELLQKILARKKHKIAVACMQANKDAKADKILDEWQGFDGEIDGEWK